MEGYMASKKPAKTTSTTKAPATKRAAAASAPAAAPRASGQSASTFMEWATSPTVKYIAGGVATAVLARIATNISTKYPELSNFLKENIDTVESKLLEFKSGLNSEDSANVQH